MRPWQGRTQDDALKAAWQELTAQAKEKPWLLKLLANQGATLAARYALWMGRLRRLRQGERRRLQRRLGVGLAGAALLLALAGGPAGASPANTITVSGACDLIEAIHNANDTTTGQPYTDCAAGDPTGADSIYLTGPVTLTASNNGTYGPTGLPVVTSEITIEGNGNTIARSGATVDFRILAVGSGGNLTLNSATVSGGVASASTPGNRGGGIYVRSATLAVSNSTLSGNSAGVYGGGIYAYSASVEVSNSTLSGNSANGGGGIYAKYATLAVANSTLSGNSAGFYGGAGIYADSATVTVSNSTLSGNSANWAGGGIYARSATLAVANSTLSGNSAVDNGGGIHADSGTLSIANSNLSGNSAVAAGGGFYAVAATVTVANSTLSGNSAGANGGGIYTRFNTVTVTNSTLSGNSAGDDGGGIYARSAASVAVTNSTLSGNSAGIDGGGLYARSATLAVTNSTLSGNSAGSDGGGIYARSATVGVSRSLVSGNTAGTGNEVFNNFSTVAAANYNLFGHDGETDTQAFYNFTPSGTDINATSDGDSVALSAILVTTLADNGSTVLAGVPPGAVVQTLALPDGSPAIDKAPSDDCVAPILDFDQRGEPRNFDGDGSASNNECDIGAFEIQTEPVPRIIVHKQTRPDGDTTPFDFRLRGPVGRDFSLADNQPHSTGVIPAGIYTLEEILPPGWDPAIPLNSLTCDDGSPLSAVDLAVDEVLVCRFLNYKRGNIIVKKVTLPAVAAPSFSMRLINNTSLQKTFFSLANAQQFDTGAITSVPTYKLLETLPAGWKRKNIVCDNGSPSTAIAVPPGGTVTCTVTNENTAPSNISLSNSSVLENKAIGTLVGNLSAADAVGGDTHTFSFVNDGAPAAANNGNFQIAGNQLKTAKKFDFEQKISHNIKLMVTDSAGQTRVKAFVITILDGLN